MLCFIVLSSLLSVYNSYTVLHCVVFRCVVAVEEARMAERENEEAAAAKIKRDRLARVAADNEKSSHKAGKTGRYSRCPSCCI